MLQAAVSDVPPALTPRTLDGLIHRLQDEPKSQKLDRWIHVLQEDVKPLVMYIQSLFLPLIQSRTKAQFSRTFDAYSWAFVPYRLFLNFKLLPLIHETDFFDSYREILNRVMFALLEEALQKGFRPDRLRFLIDSYFEILTSLFRTVQEGLNHPRELLEEHQPLFQQFLYSATRFDYGLTAICLVLEGSLPTPTPQIARFMLSASEEALSELSGYCGVMQELQRGGDWRTKFGELVRGRNERLHTSPDNKMAVPGPTGVQNRSAELRWLNGRPNLLKDLRGKWVVVDRDRLVAADTDYDKARAEALRAGIERPFITYISQDEDRPFMGL